MNTQAKDLPGWWLPGLHMLPFRCCSDMQEVATLQPPATNWMPTRWNALFLKFAREIRTFAIIQTKVGVGP